MSGRAVPVAKPKQRRLTSVPPMENGPRLLIYASSEDERLIYRRTLLRHFPRALPIECASPTEALLDADIGPLDAAIVHINASPESCQLVEALRRAHPALPILTLSGVDRSGKALRIGASRFMLAGDCLQLGRIVQEMLEESGPPAASPLASDPA